MKLLVLLLAIGGAALIGFGSFVAIAAPGDGQTGMATFPAWLLGGLAGLAALGLLICSAEARPQWPVVIGLAILSLLSVAGSFYRVSHHR